MPYHLTRRSVLRVAVGGVLAGRKLTTAQTASMAWSYPIGRPGGVPGDGFIIRVGYACENLPSFPGWWHTGENWHGIEGETAGAEIYACAAGEIVFAGYDYPGPVVIVQHDSDLYSMYGHLAYTLDVTTGDRVARGQRLGRVLQRSDAPSHLHFEVRTFYERREVNGTEPSYGVHCGEDCPPGPGYWPMMAPEHPSDLGWRHPVHAIARRAFAGDDVPAGTEVVVAEGAAERTEVWSAPEGTSGATPVGDWALRAGDRYPLLAIKAGDEATTVTSAENYRLWYRIGLPESGAGWVRAVAPVDLATGSDGRASAVQFHFLPVGRSV